MIRNLTAFPIECAIVHFIPVLTIVWSQPHATDLIWWDNSAWIGSRVNRKTVLGDSMESSISFSAGCPSWSSHVSATTEQAWLASSVFLSDSLRLRCLWLWCKSVIDKKVSVGAAFAKWATAHFLPKKNQFSDLTIRKPALLERTKFYPAPCLTLAYSKLSSVVQATGGRLPIRQQCDWVTSTTSNWSNNRFFITINRRSANSETWKGYVLHVPLTKLSVTVGTLKYKCWQRRLRGLCVRASRT